MLDPDAAEKLRSLGYVSLAQPGPVATDAPEAADPKDEIGFYNQILRATELAEDGHLRESTALLVKAEAEHPQIGLVPYLEGENLLALGQPREAMQCYRRALKLNPGAEQTAMGLGHAAYLAGDATEATKAYQWALALNPNNFIVRLALARVDWQLNQFQEAADEQRKVLRAHPRFGQAQADYGVTLAHLKKYDAALTSLKQGLELGYHTANTYNFLGNTYLALGHDKEALEAYERASREDPKDATAYINLAAIYAKLGDRDRSQQNLQKGCGLNPGLCRRMASRPH